MILRCINFIITYIFVNVNSFLDLLKIIFRSNSTKRNYEQNGGYTIIYYNLITNGYNLVTFIDVYWEMLYNFIINLSERAVALKNFSKGIPAVHKIVLSFIAAGLIIFFGLLVLQMVF